MAPATFTVLDLSYSDGTSATHPTNTTKPEPASDGSWDYFRPIAPDEPKGFLWRTKGATALVEMCAPVGQQTLRNYIFKTLPAGYKLFEHIKGKADGTERKDTYLFGHPNGSRFRSPAEFIPHVYHLASKAPDNAGNVANANKICQCKYCGISMMPRNLGSARKPVVCDPDTVLARREVSAEERLGEQEMVGWVMRKGEIVWVWAGPEEALLDLAETRDSDLWHAGVVIEKPSVNPPLSKPSPIRDIEMDDAAPWQEAPGQGYTLLLCTATSTPGKKFTNVQQHFLRPWLSRPWALNPNLGKQKCPSILAAHEVVSSLTLFDKTQATTAPNSTDPATLFNGLFLGAEKLFVGDPVRIASPNLAGPEDVLVIDNIYISNYAPAKSLICVTGSVYHISASRPLTPEQFAQLPWRMRRLDPVTGSTLCWSIRNTPTQRGECSIKLVLGRWYEPAAVSMWLPPNDANAGLGQKSVSVWVANRACALGWESIDGIELMQDEDRRQAEKAVRMTPERGFISVNMPGSAGKSRMARAVEGDDEDDEYDEDDEDTEAELEEIEEFEGNKTSNRKPSFRAK